jgi:hypothetical protein
MANYLMNVLLVFEAQFCQKYNYRWNNSRKNIVGDFYHVGHPIKNI